jgi:hypothetical protein
MEEISLGIGKYNVSISEVHSRNGASAMDSTVRCCSAALQAKEYLRFAIEE